MNYVNIEESVATHDSFFFADAMSQHRTLQRIRNSRMILSLLVNEEKRGDGFTASWCWPLPWLVARKRRKRRRGKSKREGSVVSVRKDSLIINMKKI